MPNEIFYFKDSVIPEEISGISPEVFLPIRSGLLEEMQVEIEYENSENHQKRKILPEVLFRASEEWYVAAYCFVREEPRTFRLDRIISAEVTDIKEASYGIAEDIRENGIPWKRDPKPPFEARQTEEKSSGSWVKLDVSPGENGPEIHVESSSRNAPAPKTAREFSFDLVYDTEHGYFDRIKEDLAAGADINFLSGSGNTPFTAAASRGDVDIMKYLIDHGADPFARTLDGATALMSATRSGKMDAVRYLVEELDLEVNASDRHLWTPLFYAVLDRRFEMLEYYLAHGADINCRDREKRTLLMEAIDRVRENDVSPLKFAEKLIQEGIDIHAQDGKGRTALYCAIENNLPDAVRLLLSHGISVVHFDKKGASPLLFAFQSYDEKTWRLPEQYRNTPERYQSLKEIVHLLVRNGADIQTSDRKGVTPLMLAHGVICTYLLKNRACANAFDRNGKTVAMHHIHQFDELDQLKEYGADLCARDFDGNDILSFVPMEYDAIRDFVKRFGVPVTNRNDLGDTLLHRAARAERTDWDLIKFLIRHGADPLAKNNEGDAPADHFPLACAYRKRLLSSHYTEIERRRLEKIFAEQEREERERYFVQE